MICRIADLYAEVPAAGGMSPRCQDYFWNKDENPDIVIHADRYRMELYPEASAELVAYIESGIQFYTELLQNNGMMLHASAIEVGGRAYLFSANCGVGKSTHAALWKNKFGEEAQIFNDDKPALRKLGGCWYAYGTPWCGKDGINSNVKVPLAGICFLRQSQENRIRRLVPKEIVPLFLAQTLRFGDAFRMELLLQHVDKLAQEIPIFELENRPEEAAARLSYETMRKAAEEAGL